MNIGFETENPKEFATVVSFLNQYRDKDSDLFHKILPCVIPDTTNSVFGIRVHTDNLKKLVDEINTSEKPAVPPEQFFIRTRDGLQADLLADSLRLQRAYPDGKYEIRSAPLGNNWFQIASVNQRKDSSFSRTADEYDSKKKRIHPRYLVIGGIVGAAVITLLILASKADAANHISENPMTQIVEGSVSEKQKT